MSVPFYEVAYYEWTVLWGINYRIKIMISISKTSIIPDNHAELEGSRLWSYSP